MNKIKLGLIGGGYWGTILKNTIDKLSFCEIVAVHDLEKPKFDIPYYNHLLDFLYYARKSDMQAVLIATPPSTHFSLAKECLDHNFHIFVEKPLTQNKTHALELCKASAEKRKIIFCDSTFVFAPETRFIKDALELQRFGSPVLVRSARTNYGPFSKDGTDVIFDLLIHDITLIKELFGEIKYVSATASAFKNPEICDDCRATFTTNKGLKIDVHTSWLAREKSRKFEIVTDRGFITTHFNGAVFFDSFEGERQEFQMEKTSALEIELAHFIEAIKNPLKPYKSNGLDAYENVVILEKVMQSTKSGGSEVIV
jgi:predicted dehydrogenase